jgi:hypothetical protein
LLLWKEVSMNSNPSTMFKERQNGLYILYMNSEVTWTVSFSTTIKEFAKNKASKVFSK